MQERWSVRVFPEQGHQTTMIVNIAQFALPHNETCEVFLFFDTRCCQYSYLFHLPFLYSLSSSMRPVFQCFLAKSRNACYVPLLRVGRRSMVGSPSYALGDVLISSLRECL